MTRKVNSIAHETLVKGRHSELLAQVALLANGWSVSEPLTPEPFDLVARPPGKTEWLTIQIKTARTRDDRDGSIVVYGRKNSGKPYDKTDCDLFMGIVGNDVYMFDCREISEYWVTPTNIDEKWTKLETEITKGVTE